MKTRTRKDSLKNLTKLSTSRITNRTHFLGNSSNPANSLFGPRKNVLVTYSKSRPVHILKKYHFHSPDTPHVSTPDSLQTTGKEQETNVEDKSKSINSQGSGESCTAGKMQSSLKDSNIKPLTPGSLVKPTLALRNISNIPIDKTFSRNQCTPRRDDSQAIQPSTTAQRLKAKTDLTPFSGKLKGRRFPKNNGRKKLLIASLRLDENEVLKSQFSATRDIETVASLLENEKQEQMCLSNSTLKQKNKKREKPVTQESTNYSIKSMSTDTEINTKSNYSQVNTLTSLRSMSFCTMVEVKDKEDIEHVQSTNKNPQEEKYNAIQYNSTFNEGVDEIHVEDYITEPISPIKEFEKSDEYNKENDSGKFQATIIEQDPKNTEELLPLNAPRTSTPGDQEKINALPMDKELIHEIIDEQESECPTQGLLCQDASISDAPRTSAPTDQGKSHTAPVEEVLFHAMVGQDPYSAEEDLPLEDAPRTSTPIDQGKTNVATFDELAISPIAKVYDNKKLLTKPEDTQVSFTNEKESRHCRGKEIINTETAGNRCKSISPKTKTKLEENSKNKSLPLQASMCIEDDSDKESLPDNITPEVMPTMKSQCSTSKRKLDYRMPFKPNTKQCILQDFPCTVKKSCNYKVWIKKSKSHKDLNDRKKHTFPLDILRRVFH